MVLGTQPRISRLRYGLLLPVLVLILCSCSSPRVFFHPNADPSFYERVGVVPFQSLSGDRMAGTKLSTAFVTELYVAQLFEVVETGAFREILQSELETVRRDAAELTPEELTRIGQAANIQGIFEGTVTDFEMVRIGQSSYPLITLEVRLLDTATGQVVWSTRVTKRGGPKVPVFGWGEVHTLGELAGDVAQDAVGRLAW